MTFSAPTVLNARSATAEPLVIFAIATLLRLGKMASSGMSEMMITPFTRTANMYPLEIFSDTEVAPSIFTFSYFNTYFTEVFYL